MAAGLFVFFGGCDWSDIDDVPDGFADGVDNTLAAGPGLVSDGAGTIAVDFEGTGSGLGSLDTVARSDHDHDADYVNTTGDTMTGDLTINTDLFVKDVIQAGTVYSLGDYNKIGSGGTPNSAMNSSSDLFVADQLQVGGYVYFGDDVYAGDDVLVTDMVLAGRFNYSTAQTRYASVAACAFSPQYDGLDYYSHGFLGLSAGASGIFTAPIQLPHGAVVTELRVYILDDSSNEHITVYLFRKDFDGSSAQMASTGTTDPERSGSVISHNDTTISYATIDNANNAYYLSAYFDGSVATDLHGVRVTYTVYTPLP